MDEISRILAEENPTEEDMSFLKRVGNEVIEFSQDIFAYEILPLCYPSPYIIEICKGYSIMFEGEYESWSGFKKMIKNPLSFINRLKEINLDIPIEDYIFDQLVPIIFFQGLDYQQIRYTSIVSGYLFIWMKAFLALQMIMRGLRT